LPISAISWHKPSVVAECAGHQALCDFGADVLASGADLATVSSGALANAEIETRLRRAAAETGRRILVTAGAIVGIDGLAAARLGGLSEVTYIGSKPVAAWRSTAAEGLIDLRTLNRAETFYRGLAREAAALFPKNANVTATVALAGLGFDRTRVELIADPASQENIHELRYRGTFGEAQVRIMGRPSASNPKTSALTALSMLRTLQGSSQGALIL
jgi:aspartate dehydrogenase